MSDDNIIAKNKRAYFDYHIEHEIEAGIVLEGWEVKALRLGFGQLTDSYAIVRGQQAELINMKIQPPSFAAQHKIYDPSRTRRLLLHKKELLNLQVELNRKGLTLIPLKLYWTKNKKLVKCLLGVAKGKNLVDKRHSIAEKDWTRQKQRLTKLSRLS